MNSRRLGVMIALFLLAAVPYGVAAQTQLTEHTLTTGPDSSRPAMEVEDAAWLAGRWIGEGLGAVAEETWLPPAAGAMVGVFRLIREGEVEFYELVTLVEDEGSLTLRLKHFTSDLVGWEAKEESVSFPLLRRGPHTLWFDGLTIQRLSADRMRIWVALGTEGGAEFREARFVYRREGAGEEPRGTS